MATSKRSDLNQIDEETKKIRKTQEEKFKGKLTEVDTKLLLILSKGDPDQALTDFCNSSITDLKEKIEGTTDDVNLKKDAVLKALQQKTETGKVLREYACRPCDRVWWWWSPARKQVSKCRTCRVKYDPVPEEKVFGWAVYECDCGQTFSGYGQKGITFAQCYKRRGGCGKKILPKKILPPNRKKMYKSKSVKTDTETVTEPFENENATDYEKALGANLDPIDNDPPYEGAVSKEALDVNTKRNRKNRAKYDVNEDLYRDMGKPIDTGSRDRTLYIGQRFRAEVRIGYDVQKMPWPRGKQRKSSKKSPIEVRELSGGKKVLFASSRHVSTGSTVDTYLTQDDDMSITSSFIAYLPKIDEDT